ncbi:MAG: hypothetical protein Q8J88_02620 [Bacteroidales bacterium]|nr:hypothetical protein [Bacteroidales bacterium]
MYKLTLIITLCLITASCSNSRLDDDWQHIYFENPPLALNLDVSEAETVNFKHILVPQRVYVVDSLYILYQTTEPDYFFTVYDKSFNKIGAFGRKGMGPGEFQSVRYKNQYFYSEEGSLQMWVYDGTFFNGYLIDLNEAMLVSDDSYIITKIALPLFVQTLPEFFFIDPDNGIGRSDMYSEGRYFKSSTDGFLWFGMFPQLDGIAHPENKKLAYHASSSFQDGLLYSAMTFFPRIDVFYPNGNPKLSIIKKTKHILPNFLDESNPFNSYNVEYYYDIFVGENNIYALFVGQSRQELRTNLSAISSFLYVFDKSGEIKYNLKLPYLVSSFTIDEKRNRLMIFDRSKEDAVLNIWDLNKVLK